MDSLPALLELGTLWRKDDGEVEGTGREDSMVGRMPKVESIFRAVMEMKARK